MTLDEARALHDSMRSSVLAMEIVLSRSRHMLGLTAGAILNPSPENLGIVAAERERQLEFIESLVPKAGAEARS